MGMKTMKLLCLVLALATSGTLRADDDSKTPCQRALEKLCPSQKGRLNCTREHEADLSEACGDTFSKEKTRPPGKAFEKFLDECRPDIARLCPEARAGGGRVIGCLNQKRAELTPECLAEVDSALAKGLNRTAKDE